MSASWTCLFFQPCANAVPGSLCQPAKNFKTLDKQPLQIDEVIFYCSESSAAGYVRISELCNTCFHFHIQNFPDRILGPTECDGLYFNL